MVVRSRITRHQIIAAGALCIVLPTIFASTAVLLGSPDAVTVFSTFAGATIAVLLSSRTWMTLTYHNVTLTLSLHRSEEELRRLREEVDLRERVTATFSSTENEPATIEALFRTVAEIIPEAEISLSLNLPGDDHLAWQVRSQGGRLQAASPIVGSPSCRALVTNSTVVAGTTHVVDVCEHLIDRVDDVSSICVPIDLGDSTLGILNALAAPGEPPDPQAVRQIEWAVSKAAVRIAEQRLSRGPSVAGLPDPVTGLPGRAALRNQITNLTRTLMPFSMCVISIDRFEEIVLLEGHEVAEDSLRYTADALSTTVRPDDFMSRFDDSSFAVILPGCDVAKATAAIERVRESLVLLLALESLTSFTVSVGIVESRQAQSIDDLFRLAENACQRAVGDGGNRIATSFEADHL